MIKRYTNHQDGYQHRTHNKNLLYVHLIFVTKYRKSLLVGKTREDVKQLIYESCVKHHFYIDRMETDKDHIHILLQYPPTVSVSHIVKLLKQESTYHIWRIHAKELKHYYWRERTFWSDGYFAASIGEASKETIQHYIENQG